MDRGDVMVLQLFLLHFYASQVFCAYQSWHYQEVHEEVCQLDVFEPKCPENHVVLIKDALYGHLRLGKCIDRDIGHFGCQADVTRVVTNFCSGRQTCSISMPNAEIAKTEPCVKAISTALEVSYICQPVFTPDVISCEHLPYYNVSASSGYLASSVTMETKCGNQATPWIINAKPGQKINITLLDFGIDTDPNRYTGMGYYDPILKACKDYGIIQDDVIQNPTMICGGQSRKSLQLHTTKSQVNISFSAYSNDVPQYFMLHFEVLGCADEPQTETTWFERSSEHVATMGCIHTKITWSLKCEHKMWVGRRANCSLALPPETHKDGGSYAHISYSLAISIILGAALVVCSLIVIIGIIRYRRREDYDYNATYNTQTMLLRQHRHHHQGPPPEEYELRCTCPVPLQSTSKVQQHLTPDTHRSADEQHRTMTIRRSPHVPRHYSLKKSVEVEGNDYEHIWQAPAGKAGNSGSKTSPTKTSPSAKTSPSKITQASKTSPCSAHPDALNNDSSKQNTLKYSYNNNNNIDGDGKIDCKTAASKGDKTISSSSSRSSSFKIKNNEEEESQKSKPYYVTSKDILSNGPKESYGSFDCQTSVIPLTIKNNTAADV